MDIIRAIEQQQIKSDLPEFHVGDNVKVHYRITEGNRERIQVFQGDVIRRHGHGVRETFTVRKISFSIGVERTFPVHSRRSTRSRSPVRAMSVAPSCTTSATRWARPPRSRRSPSAKPIFGICDFKNPHPNGGGVLLIRNTSTFTCYRIWLYRLERKGPRDYRSIFVWRLRWLERSLMASRGYRLRSCLGLR